MANFSELFGGGFDTRTVEPTQEFTLLPPGKYAVQIDKVVCKPTQAQNGHFLEIDMTVLGSVDKGEYKNRKLWDRINIENPSQKCVEIGLQKVSALGHAVGEAVIQSEDQFVGKVCIACVKVKGEYNEITTYKSVEAIQAEAKAPAAQQNKPAEAWGSRPTPAQQAAVAQQPAQAATSFPADAPPGYNGQPADPARQAAGGGYCAPATPAQQAASAQPTATKPPWAR